VRLDLERLDRIREAVGERAALVLHGGSGVPEELLREAVAHGISKINFGTELKNTFTRTVKTTLAATDEIDLRKNICARDFCSPANGGGEDQNLRGARPGSVAP